HVLAFLFHLLLRLELASGQLLVHLEHALDAGDSQILCRDLLGELGELGPFGLDLLPQALRFDPRDVVLLDDLAAKAGKPLSQPRDRGGLRFGVVRSESTRLNSSHGSISYAVFCLKKKKELIID